MPNDTGVAVKGDETPYEVLASSIVKLADGLDAMKRSGLSRRAIVVILHDLTRVAKRDIEAILDAPIRTFMLVK